eukprot:Filipodium_phascolosomae@DN6686_c0_g1_i1.p1
MLKCFGKSYYLGVRGVASTVCIPVVVVVGGGGSGVCGGATVVSVAAKAEKSEIGLIESRRIGSSRNSSSIVLRSCSVFDIASKTTNDLTSNSKDLFSLPKGEGAETVSSPNTPSGCFRRWFRVYVEHCMRSHLDTPL